MWTILKLVLLLTLLDLTWGQVRQQQRPQAKAPQRKQKALQQPQTAKSADPSDPTSSSNVFVDEQNFCVPAPGKNMPAYYRSRLDGAVCCRGNILQAATVLPETQGPCAISGKTNANGIFDPAPLWCSYTCTLKKIGAIDKTGHIHPDTFLNHLSRGLGNQTRAVVKQWMQKLGCLRSFKNDKFPCYTPLGFHKCYNDALEFMCNFGRDFSQLKQAKREYIALAPSCEIEGRQVTPYCCHGKPLPWTIPDIIEAPRNVSKMANCMKSTGARVCSATCFMHSAGVVDNDFELDVDAFSKEILGIFSLVQPSIWMNFLGPTYVFFDETLEELSAPIPTADRVCLFHDKILNYHEDKIHQYCSMTPEQVAEILPKPEKSDDE